MKKIILFGISSLFFSACKKDTCQTCHIGAIDHVLPIVMTNGDTLPYTSIIHRYLDNNAETWYIATNLPDNYKPFNMDGYPVDFCYKETGVYVEFEYNPAPPHDDVGTYPLVELCDIKYHEF